MSSINRISSLTCLSELSFASCFSSELKNVAGDSVSWSFVNPLQFICFLDRVRRGKHCVNAFPGETTAYKGEIQR